MSGPVLQLAAFGCLGVGVALILIRWSQPFFARSLQVRRFRRNLRSIDQVVDVWQRHFERRHVEDEMRRPALPHDPGPRQLRRDIDPEPGAGAAA